MVWKGLGQSKPQGTMCYGSPSGEKNTHTKQQEGLMHRGGAQSQSKVRWGTAEAQAPSLQFHHQPALVCHVAALQWY